MVTSLTTIVSRYLVNPTSLNIFLKYYDIDHCSLVQIDILMIDHIDVDCNKSGGKKRQSHYTYNIDNSKIQRY